MEKKVSYRTTAIIVLASMAFGAAVWTGIAYAIGWLINRLG